ncbi:MAG TPA: DUF418 domain-containing protein [Bacilli bacterium]|nr:DUF418 domain-containing protein [Bacilli bacterium]
MSQSQQIAPTSMQERVVELDAIRGFAILGILLVNMSAFSAPMYQYGAEQAFTGLDAFVHQVLEAIVRAKFYTMFSFLFGLGMVFFLERAEKKGIRAVPLFRRRLLMLLGFGLVHAYLIWSGDILTEYALLGFVLVLFYRAKPRKLLLFAAVSWLLPLLFTFTPIYFWVRTIYIKLHFTQGLYPHMLYTEGMQAYGSGSYWDMVVQRFHELLMMYGGYYGSMPTLLTMFLLGVWAGKKRIFHNLGQHVKFLRIVLVVGLVVGGGLTLFEVFGPQPMTDSQNFWFRMFWYRLADPALCFFYIATLALLLQNRVWQTRLAPLAFVGRMAISNYLLCSVICTTIFYNYGFGLFTKVGPAKGLLMTLLIYTLLMVFSVFWLSKYRFGPVEWLWRTLTYGKRQPMRIQPRTDGKKEPASNVAG